MSRPEALLERQVLHALGSDPALAIFRNECGEGFYGNVRQQIRDALVARPDLSANVMSILNRSRVHFGLHNGSADLCGVLAPNGRFVSLELKSADGVMRPDQLTWLARMRELGALAEEVRSPGEAALYIDEARRGLR